MLLKILTFNIHKGLNATSTKLMLPEIYTLLRAVDADIVFLQEVQGEHKQRKDHFADWPEKSQTEFLAKEAWPYYFYGQNHTHEYGHHGNAILSKFPLTESFNKDISASRFSNRGLLYSQIHLATVPSPIHLICTHFGLLKKERQQQFDLLNTFIANELAAGEPLLIAGDFNDWRKKSLELLSESLGLHEVFNQMHGAHAKTYPADLPLLQMDRIYYRGLMPSRCQIVNVKGLSDHLPLMAEFSLPRLKS